MKQKELLIIAVSIFLTIVAWVSIELYKVRTSEVVGQPITLPKVGNHTIDINVLERLREKSQQ
ncbi:MAG: hypothetical protein N2691_01265 [Patescibacteria group bacterium]|nr:hypothetical protein [Patescibacteria group bacterium]